MNRCFNHLSSPILSAILPFLVVVSLVGLLSGCAGQAPIDGPILVLYAFGEEGAELRGQMSVDRTDRQLGRAVHVGKLSEKNVLLAESGMGLVNAAMTTQAIIDVYKPRAVVFTGIAGAVDTGVHIGDIVVCRRWHMHDYGYFGREGLSPRPTWLYVPFKDSIVQVSAFAVDSSLYAGAEVLVNVELGLRAIGDRSPRLILGGNGVSGNSFIDNADKRLWLSDAFEALITDMESAAVAHVCAVNDLPFIIFRSASDLAGGSGTESAKDEMEQFFEIAATNSSKVLLKFLKTP